MNERALRPANVAAGVMVLAGGLMMVIPQHALSIVQVAIVAAAAAAGLYALAAHVPTGGWISPFRWGSPFGEAPRVARTRVPERDLSLVRGRMSGVRYPLDGAPPLPLQTLRILKSLVHDGLDLGPDAAQDPATRPRVTPLIWAVLRAEVPGGPVWRRWLRARPPNPRAVASVVERVLDDINHLAETLGPNATASSSNQGPT